MLERLQSETQQRYAIEYFDEIEIETDSMADSRQAKSDDAPPGGWNFKPCTALSSRKSNLTGQPVHGRYRRASKHCELFLNANTRGPIVRSLCSRNYSHPETTHLLSIQRPDSRGYPHIFVITTSLLIARAGVCTWCLEGYRDLL